MPFDKPTDADLDHPDRMWLDQLAGRRNFDPSAFMGLINDMSERDDWQAAFAGLPNGTGVVAKLSDFFARHQGGLRDHERRFLYFHPLQRNALGKDRLIELAQRHVVELAAIAELAGAHELRERLSSLRTLWADETPQRDPMQQSNDFDIEIYETISDYLDSNKDVDAPWFYCLSEACYAIAANYDLQRYFMSDYYRIRFDYGACYELWIGGGKLFFDDDRCLVTQVERR